MTKNWGFGKKKVKLGMSQSLFLKYNVHLVFLCTGSECKCTIIAKIIYVLEKTFYGLERLFTALKRLFMALRLYLQNSEFIFDHMMHF